jgi:hypothetical protein
MSITKHNKEIKPMSNTTNLEAIINLLPENFAAQLTDTSDEIVISKDLWNKVRISFVNLSIEEEILYGRLQVYFIYDNNYQMLPLDGEAKGTNSRGFRTGTLNLSSLAEIGVFTEANIAALKIHAQKWMEHGSDAMYAEYKNYRAFLKPINPASAQFIFNLTVFRSPDGTIQVPGMDRVCWCDMELIGKDITPISEFGSFGRFVKPVVTTEAVESAVAQVSTRIIRR